MSAEDPEAIFRIPILFPYSNSFPKGRRDELKSVLTPLGFETVFEKCESVAEALRNRPVFSGGLPAVGFPICIPILSKGLRVEPGKHFEPCPRVRSTDVQGKPNKKLVLFLIEDSLRDNLQPGSIPADGDYTLIEFNAASMFPSVPELIGSLMEMKEALRADHYEYQLPDVLRSALNFNSVEKRVYVRPDKFGIVEYKWQILGSAARKAYNKDIGYVFRHKIGVIAAPHGDTRNSLPSLKDAATDSLDEIFNTETDSFGVVAFGDGASVTWKPSERPDRASQWIDIIIRPNDGRKTFPHDRLISYGLLWSCRNLLSAKADTSSFVARHNYERVDFSVRFMRTDLSKESLTFTKGPRMERYGPYQNDLGSIDTEGLEDERFHHYLFPWHERRVPAGMRLRVIWELKDDTF